MIKNDLMTGPTDAMLDWLEEHEAIEAELYAELSAEEYADAILSTIA